MIPFEKKKTPLEMVKIVSDSAQAESIKRAIAPVLGKELNNIVTQLATIKPDLGAYSFLAGQAHIVHKILKSVEVSMDEAKESHDKIRRQGL